MLRISGIEEQTDEAQSPRIQYKLPADDISPLPLSSIVQNLALDNTHQITNGLQVLIPIRPLLDESS